MTARILPTGPGWWWVRVGTGAKEPVWVENGIAFVARLGSGTVAVGDLHFDWLAPVAPIGSVPPEVCASRVFGAYRVGFADGLEGDTAGRNVTAGVLVATLEAHGLSPDEAARVVAGVAS